MKAASSSPVLEEDFMQNIHIIAKTPSRRVFPLPLLSAMRAVLTLLSVGFGLIGDAHKMAYVDPFFCPRRQPKITPDREP